MTKQKLPPPEGAWRITEVWCTTFSASEKHSHAKRWLYDSYRTYTTQLRLRKSSAKEFMDARKDGERGAPGSTYTTCTVRAESFNGAMWVDIEATVYSCVGTDTRVIV